MPLTATCFKNKQQRKTFHQEPRDSKGPLLSRKRKKKTFRLEPRESRGGTRAPGVGSGCSQVVPVRRVARQRCPCRGTGNRGKNVGTGKRRASSEAVGHEPPHRLLGASPHHHQTLSPPRTCFFCALRDPALEDALHSPCFKTKKKTCHQEPRDFKGYTLIEMRADLTAVPHASLISET